MGRLTTKKFILYYKKSTLLMLGSSRSEWHFSLCSAPIDQLLSDNWLILSDT